MGCLVFSIIAIAVIILIASASTPTQEFDKLMASGIAARGILLTVASTGSRVASTTLRRFERRFVILDVEIPGRPPYEVSVNALIPSNLVRDVLPGATVELRIDRAKPGRIAIVGPGAALAAAGFLPPSADGQPLSTSLANPLQAAGTQGGTPRSS